jgi:hypothetical protein
MNAKVLIAERRGILERIENMYPKQLPITRVANHVLLEILTARDAADRIWYQDGLELIERYEVPQKRDAQTQSED